MSTPPYFDSDDDVHHIGRGLLDRSLPKREWTHAAHFAAALWLLRRSPEETFAAMPRLIRAYNEATGVPNTSTEGYHETITLASLRAARHLLSLHDPATPLYRIANELLVSRFGRPSWILAHWSRTVLFSPLARKHWVEPDLLPLPF